MINLASGALSMSTLFYFLSFVWVCVGCLQIGSNYENYGNKTSPVAVGFVCD